MAVLPWGATEAHNYHLPYGTDTIQSERVAAEAARIAVEQGAGVVVLPAIPFGVQTGQRDVPLCINLNPSTQLATLSDIAESLQPHGVRKLVILNGHGGNDFRGIIRELDPLTDLSLFALDWYRCVPPGEYFEEPGDHAGELETSVTMHLAPDLVLPLDRAGSGMERVSRLRAVREGWAWTPRRWVDVTVDTGVGNPAKATEGKGASYFTAVTRKIAGFLVELDDLDPADAYRDA